MTPNPQPRPQRYVEARQESLSSDSAALFDDNLRDNKSSSTLDLKEEDSSNCSNRLTGSGSGSGAGYNADCSSSSDSSSLSSKQKTVSTDIQQRVGNLSYRQDQDDIYPISKTPKNDARRERVATSLNEKSEDANKEEKGSEMESDHGAQSYFQRFKASNENGLDHANRTVSTMHCYAVLPQWNGVRISHPMDPRIDLSTVGYTLSTPAPSGNASEDVNDYGNHPQSLDRYLHLMEAVRPFFNSFDTSAKPKVEVRGASDGTNAGSSEGFTSFFTTTHNNTNSSDSYSDTKLYSSSPAGGDPARRPTNQSCIDQTAQNECEAASDSSMIALARMKRKHQKRRHEESAEDSTFSGERKVRHGDQEGSSADAEEQLLHPQYVAKALNETPQNGVGAPEVQIRPDNLSSSSDEAPRQMPPAIPTLPIVSESSDAFARGGFSSMSNPTTTSGSGSGGISGLSGSNNGSSGSGNEGKGENSGGDGNSNSDENQASPGAKPNSDADKKMHADDQPALCSQQAQEPRPHSCSPTLWNQPADTGDQDAGREKKLMDKKRKRMNMRREYEEQVQHDMESSESSEGPDSTYFEPGKPATLDTALSFSKRARLIVQAIPPLLVVHTNGAFTRLTGVDSHEVNGRSVSSMFALPHPATRDYQDTPQNNEQESHQVAAAAGRARAQDDSFGMNVERLVVANGFGQYQVIDVEAKPEATNSDNCTIQCQMAVSPVVANSPLDSLEPAVVTDTNQEAHHRRRKHHHDHTKPMEHHHRSVITHYVIQLEKVDATLQTPLSAEPSDREMLLDLNEEALDEASQSTDPKEPVSSIG